jgi:hypothetical protein
VGQEPSGEIELHSNSSNNGQGMAKEVVQIACDALALRFLGQTFDLRVRTFEKRIGSRMLGEGKVSESNDHAVEEDVFVCGKWMTDVSSLRHDSGHHCSQHQEQGAQTAEEKAKHREGIDKHSVGRRVERVIEKCDEKEQQ